MSHTTRGSWKAEQVDGFWNVYSETGLVCEISQWADVVDEADARLISAAPDYDEVVREIADDLGMAEWACPQDAEQILLRLIAKLYPRSRAAIAKAEGK